jgi:hypothetical protein
MVARMVGHDVYSVSTNMMNIIGNRAYLPPRAGLGPPLAAPRRD